jgi:hypothetical protein
VDLDGRRFIDAQHLVAIEIRLLDAAVSSIGYPVLSQDSAINWACDPNAPLHLCGLKT